MPPAAPHEFRQLMSRFATGVTVVTALDPAGKPAGMTVSALASVSLDPPLLSICVDRKADLHPVLSQTRAFAVNVLAADQEAISRQFAATGADRFAGVRYRAGPWDLPLIEGAVAHIWCERWGEHPAGDHTVFFGLVTGGRTFDRPPLVHYRSGYTTTRGPGGARSD